jgi:hypothetical protein
MKDELRPKRINRLQLLESAQLQTTKNADGGWATADLVAGCKASARRGRRHDTT